MSVDDVSRLETFLGHGTWGHRLVRALVHDDDEAKDVLQEARLAAWRSAPRDEARLRSWVGSVVRNLARNHVRSTRRRRAIEAAVVREATETVADPQATLVWLEMQRTLLELLTALRPAFRDVLVLRYHEGLTAAAIAKRLGVPAGTVRWRIKEALDELRAALDRRHEGRGNWVVVFAPLLEAPQPAWAVRDGEAAGQGGANEKVGKATVTGGLGFFSRRALLGSVVAVCAAIVTALSWPPGTSPGAVSAGGATKALPPKPSRLPQHAPPRLTLVLPHDNPDKDGANTNHDDEPPIAPELPRWALGEGHEPRRIRGVVREEGRPLVGAAVRISPGMITFSRAFDRHAVTNEGGRFDLGLQPATNWFLTVSMPGRAPVIRYVDLRGDPAPLVEGRASDDLVISLSPCQTMVRGTVRDSDGGAIADARVALAASWNNGGVATHSDAAGAFAICVPHTSAPVFTYTLVASANGYGTVETQAPQTTKTIDFHLEPQARVEGRVSAVAGGAPLGGVKVTLMPMGDANPNAPPIVGVQPVRLETFSDANGVYEIAGLAPGRYRVEAQADDHLPPGPPPQLALAAGEHRHGFDLALARAAVVEGTCRIEGAPAANHSLWFHGREGAAWFALGWTMSRQDGGFRVRLPLGTVVDRMFVYPGRGRGNWPQARSPSRIVVDRAHQTGIEIDFAALP